MTLHVRTGTGRGTTVTGAIYSRDSLCPLGEDVQLVLGGIIDPPQRLHKGKAYLGATGERESASTYSHEEDTKIGTSHIAQDAHKTNHTNGTSSKRAPDAKQCGMSACAAYAQLSEEEAPIGGGAGKPAA
jgi:hypothetical protein